MRHYVNARNMLDGLELDHGFGRSYRSCLTACASFVEDDPRLSQSILDQHHNHTDATKVKFACVDSVEALICEKLEKLTVASSTVSGLVSAMHTWIDNNEPKENRFCTKGTSKCLHISLSAKILHKGM